MSDTKKRSPRRQADVSGVRYSVVSNPRQLSAAGGGGQQAPESQSMESRHRRNRCKPFARMTCDERDDEMTGFAVVKSYCSQRLLLMTPMVITIAHPSLDIANSDVILSVGFAVRALIVAVTFANDDDLPYASVLQAVVVPGIFAKRKHHGGSSRRKGIPYPVQFCGHLRGNVLLYFPFYFERRTSRPVPFHLALSLLSQEQNLLI